MPPTLLAAAGLTAALGLVLLAALALTAWMAEPTVIGPQDAQLILQPTATKTASFNGAAVDLGNGFAPSGGGEPMQCIINFSALDRVTGDETYSFRVEDSPDNSTFTARSVDRTVAQEGFTTTGATGTFVISCNITQRYVRLVGTLGGTTPSITLISYLQPQINA